MRRELPKEIDITEHVVRIANYVVEEVAKARDELMRDVEVWADKQELPPELKDTLLALAERRLTSRLVANLCATILNSWARQLGEELMPRLPSRLNMILDAVRWLAAQIPLLIREPLKGAGLLPEASLLVAMLAAIKTAGTILEAMIRAEEAITTAASRQVDNSHYYTT